MCQYINSTHYHNTINTKTNNTTAATATTSTKAAITITKHQRRAHLRVDELSEEVGQPWALLLLLALQNRRV